MSKEEVEEEATTTTTVTTKSGRPSLSEAEVNILSDGHQHCLVCYSDLSYRGKLPCQHDDICGVCHLRLRYLHNDQKCPICKQHNDQVIVDKSNTNTDTDNKKYHDYTQWGDNEIGPGYVYRDDVHMFFERTYFETEIVPLFASACNVCDFIVDETTTQSTSKKNSAQRILEDHIKNQHRLQMCRLCIDHKRDFIARLPRMTHNQLQNHLRNGDGPTSGFNGHPVCEFCRPKRFYDLNYLHQHLHKEHYKCHICEKQGKDNQWFKNYISLERHFDKSHFLCHDVQCLSARFMVFENELDLRAHEMSAHGGTSTGSTKINLEFRTRRMGFGGVGVEDEQATPSSDDFNYNVDGTAFVPDALPNQGGNSSTVPNNSVASTPLHPLHVQRTEELRAHAAAVRQQQALQSQEESFPTLQSASAAAAAQSSSSAAPLVGWASGAALQRVNRSNATTLTREAFPALPTSSSASTNAKKKAMKGNLAATRRQFGAMTTSISQQPQQQQQQHPQTSSWGNNNGSLATMPPGLSSATRPMNSVGSNPVASFNRQANLAPDNFPSLGPGPGSRLAPAAPYSAANALAKRNIQQQQQRAPAPSLNSISDFPAPPSATSTTTQSKVRQQVLGGNLKPPPQQAVDNVLQVNMVATAAAKVTVEDMKASLGPNKYKQLKRLTKEFATGDLSPEGYVDHSAALFDRGYADTDFWSYLPSLLESCPNQDSAQNALRYMTSIQRQQFATESRPKAMAAAPQPVSQWAGGRATITPVASLSQPTTSRSAPIASKKNSAWGSGGKATVVRAKAPPGSVAVAAASQGPQGGTATKFMAKQQKKESQAKTTNNNNKKMKQKDELRALAFGK